MMEDVGAARERVRKLQQHFGQANEDIEQILISADKIEKRGEQHRGARVRRRCAAERCDVHRRRRCRASSRRANSA